MAATITRVKCGERLDQLTERVLGKAIRYEELLAANPDLDIWYPEVNQKIEVPDNAK